MPHKVNKDCMLSAGKDFVNVFFDGCCAQDFQGFWHDSI